jgi:hypothetical protein
MRSKPVLLVELAAAAELSADEGRSCVPIIVKDY